MEELINILRNDKNTKPDRFGFTPLFKLAHDIKYSFTIDQIENIFKQFVSIDFELIDANDVSNLAAFLIECNFLKKELEVSRILKKRYLKINDIDKKSELFVILARLSKGLSPNELIDNNAIIIKEKNILLWLEGVINSKWFGSFPDELVNNIGTAFTLLLNQYEFDSEFLSYMSLLLKNVDNKDEIEKFFKIITICQKNCVKDVSIKEIERWLVKKNISIPSYLIEGNVEILKKPNPLIAYASLAVSKSKVKATVCLN